MTDGVVRLHTAFRQRICGNRGGRELWVSKFADKFAAILAAAPVA